MKHFKHYFEMIEDELEGAEEYIKEAISSKHDNPSMAEKLYEASKQEYAHAMMWFAFATEEKDLFEKDKSSKSEDYYNLMLEIWNEQRDEMTDKASEYKRFSEIYKEI